MNPETTVTRTITVNAPIERCFTVFTEGFDRWWPRTHHIGKAEMGTAVLEARPGGRWYERGVDGSECEWGRVLACEPPRRIVLSWQIDTAWQRDPDASRASEVEVRFVAVGPKETRVEVEHRHLERHGADWPTMAQAIGGEGGWSGLLGRFAAEV
jgi:uncharacterized protein YndB with AHSA1/START domain